MPASKDLSSQAPYIMINEVSTVAFAYAMSGFGTSAINIGSPGTALAETAIANGLR